MSQSIPDRPNPWQLVVLLVLLVAAGWALTTLLPRESKWQVQRVVRWLTTP